MARYVADRAVHIRHKGRGSTDNQFGICSPPFPDLAYVDYHKGRKLLRVKDRLGGLLREIPVDKVMTDRGSFLPGLNGDIKPSFDPVNGHIKVLVEVVVQGQNERDQYLIDTGVHWREG